MEKKISESYCLESLLAVYFVSRKRSVKFRLKAEDYQLIKILLG